MHLVVAPATFTGFPWGMTSVLSYEALLYVWRKMGIEKRERNIQRYQYRYQMRSVAKGIVIDTIRSRRETFLFCFFFPFLLFFGFVVDTFMSRREMFHFALFLFSFLSFFFPFCTCGVQPPRKTKHRAEGVPLDPSGREGQDCPCLDAAVGRGGGGQGGGGAALSLQLL